MPIAATVRNRLLFLAIWSKNTDRVAFLMKFIWNRLFFLAIPWISGSAGTHSNRLFFQRVLLFTEIHFFMKSLVIPGDSTPRNRLLFLAICIAMTGLLNFPKNHWFRLENKAFCALAAKVRVGVEWSRSWIGVGSYSDSTPALTFVVKSLVIPGDFD